MFEDEMTKRKEYMEEKITYEEYFTWLSKKYGFSIDHLTSFISKEDILKSSDPNLNDIPLEKWDRLHVHRPNNISWSLSDTVSCFKTIARKWKKEQKDENKKIDYR